MTISPFQPVSTIDSVVNPLSAHYLAAHNEEGQAVGDGEYHQDLSEARDMQQRFQAYMRAEGSRLEGFVGRTKRPYVGAGRLPNRAVAATVKTNDGLELILANRGYSSRVRQLAQDHGLSFEEANTYVLAHEHVHLLDPQLRTRSQVGGEKYVEATLVRYFTQRAMNAKGSERAKYQKLAATAHHRLQWLKKMGNKGYHDHVHGTARGKQNGNVRYQEDPKSRSPNYRPSAPNPRYRSNTQYAKSA